MGDRTVLPFLVNMARLYELFVAEWLQSHLPDGLSLKAQEKVDIGEGGALSFTIDLVLCDIESGKAVCVLDTKYKDPGQERWRIGDVYQIASYCHAAGSSQGVLIYATPTEWHWSRQLVNAECRVDGLSLALGGSRAEIRRRIGRLGAGVCGVQRLG